MLLHYKLEVSYWGYDGVCSKEFEVIEGIQVLPFLLGWNTHSGSITIIYCLKGFFPT